MFFEPQTARPLKTAAYFRPSLAASSARQARPKTTRPRASSFSAATEHTHGRREARFVRPVKINRVDPLLYVHNPENFTHEITGDSIASEDKFYDSEFTNKYKPKKWTLMANNRERGAPYHANDVTRIQYYKVARKHGFLHTMPTRIKREEVTNIVTIERTEGLTPEDLRDVFFNNTPNGKSTRRILDDFGLKSEKVTRNPIGDFPDFVVDIIPS